MKLNDFSEENQEKIKKLAEKNNCTIDVILLIWGNGRRCFEKEK